MEQRCAYGCIEESCAFRELMFTEGLGDNGIALTGPNYQIVFCIIVDQAEVLGVEAPCAMYVSCH